MQVSIERITPLVANQLLKNRPYQRKFSQATSDFYSREMQEGLWRETGESVQIDTSGCLCNGQHRLSAIVSSGKTFDMVVVRDIEPEAFDAMDQGKVRTPGDTLSRAGFKSADAVASVCANLRRFNPEQITFYKGFTKRLAREEIRNYAEKRAERLNKAVALAGMTKKVCAQSIMGTFFYLVGAIDEELSNEFALGFKTGADLAENSPILKTRNKLLDMRGMTRNGLDIVDIFPYLTNAWNKAYRAEPMSQLRTPNTGLKLIGAPGIKTAEFETWV